MKSDSAIAQEATMLPIAMIAKQLGLADEEWEPYGRYKAKIHVDVLEKMKNHPDGKLILVTAMSPTPAGEGKSTVTIGLAQALNKLSQRAIAAIREPSLGPNFGLKGGAAGGGYSQVLPMSDINLHFTGDFHAITTAHNLLAALIDNHLYQGNELHIDPDRVTWRRVLDINDRSLRQVAIGLGGRGNGVTREAGFDITVASEIMALLCLVENATELKDALARMLIGYTYENVPVTVSDLGVQGALAALLKDAIHPNLVQTIENTPAIIHGGPFGNIAHGCNSLIATQMALKLGEYVVTEAGFGADLGAEKFFDIKCRRGQLEPSAAVIVATVRALKYHGGIPKKDLTIEDLAAITRGFANLAHHARIVSEYHVPFVIALNRFPTDTDAELAHVEKLCAEHGFRVALTEVFAKGGAGGMELARAIMETIDHSEMSFAPIYDVEQSLLNKIEIICKKVYGARTVQFTDVAKRQLADCDRHGWSNLPICMAKTPYSFSDNPSLIGDVQEFTITIRDIRPSLGAEFLVCLTGDIMTMPGLPKHPHALKVDLDESGQVTGLF
ncbi:formate--tetrahydrofolate ligase [Sulfoacidibacillus ferrooxidans]|uniref:Formate--tetrahydrofolate ligase n=1 Tax=Sulfoacidibacillus ferrooxidans TaxID=2005001 RepID=A0A9X1V645_9BACL|nr:formate--tetrahydrofolate ligase [Sulfoacidibacillus ferrooxidans]MCI0182211.1 Formate--tetrahydrofolate ligase [Sulfoacidibacillus ferrooxidans]